MALGFGLVTVIFLGPFLVLGVGFVLWIAGALTIAITVFIDAKTLETADIDWQPDPFLFGLPGLFFPSIVFYYLYKRHEHVVDWVGTGRWGAVAAGNLVCSTLLVGTGLVFEEALSRFGVALLLGVIGIVLLAPFPYAGYRDTTYVRLNSETWQPNTGLMLPVAVVSMFLLPPSYLLFGGYYLYKRGRALGAA